MVISCFNSFKFFNVFSVLMLRLMAPKNLLAYVLFQVRLMAGMNLACFFGIETATCQLSCLHMFSFNFFQIIFSIKNGTWEQSCLHTSSSNSFWRLRDNFCLCFFSIEKATWQIFCLHMSSSNTFQISAISSCLSILGSRRGRIWWQPPVVGQKPGAAAQAKGSRRGRFLVVTPARGVWKNLFCIVGPRGAVRDGFGGDPRSWRRSPGPPCRPRGPSGTDLVATPGRGAEIWGHLLGQGEPSGTLFLVATPSRGV